MGCATFCSEDLRKWGTELGRGSNTGHPEWRGSSAGNNGVFQGLQDKGMHNGRVAGKLQGNLRDKVVRRLLCSSLTGVAHVLM